MENEKRKVKVTKNGPYLVTGDLPLAKEIIVPDENGDSVAYKKGEKYQHGSEYLLCRCGKSKNKPFCDKSHLKVGFDGKETASLEKFSDRCKTIKGPNLDLDDLTELCALARFCHNKKSDVWNNTEDSSNPQSKKEAIRQACLCPSGRLVARDKLTGEPMEPGFKKEIGLIEDPQKHVSGPVWVKGKIEVESSDGQKYEVRNRVALCRCGKSKNKPFCDGCHIKEKFNDGDENLK